MLSVCASGALAQVPSKPPRKIPAGAGAPSGSPSPTPPRQEEAQAKERAPASLKKLPAAPASLNERPAAPASLKEHPASLKEAPGAGREGGAHSDKHDDKFEPTPVVSAPRGSPAERRAWLRAQIDRVLADPALTHTKVGLDVVEVETGQVLYARNDGGLFNPASNTKLFTTAAALALLGPEYRWKTVVYADGPITSGELKGRLYLHGGGDPSLAVEDLWRLATALYAGGLRKVAGDLVADDTYFDDLRAPGGSSPPEEQAFRAPNGALSLADNLVTIRVSPGESEAAAARVLFDPRTPYFTLVNDALTVSAGRTALEVTTRELPDHTEVRVSGRIRQDEASQLFHRRVAHPEIYTAQVFRALLARRGITVSGGVVRGGLPPGARALEAHYSQPLGMLVRDVNKHANNFMAEQIMKTLGAETGGRPGTWQKGIDAVAGFLEQLGIHRNRYRLTNGSGLYQSNLFSPAQLTTVLRVAYKNFRFAADYVGSLALAGADGAMGHRLEGSLAERYVRAKTGTLDGVSCMAGYAAAPDQPPLAFAIFMNDLSQPAAPRARQAQDAILEALVAYQLAE